MKIFDKISVFFLFLLCIVFPYQFYSLKIPLLLYVLLRISFKILITKRAEITLSVIILFAIYIFIGLFFILYGISSGNAYPGSFKYVFALYVIFPVIYFILILGTPKKKEYIHFAEKIMSFGFILSSLVMITAYFNKRYGYFGFLHFIFDDMIVDLTGNVVKIRYHGISSLLFLFPYFFSEFILNVKGKSFKQILIRIFILALSVIAVSLSGRRALLVIFVLSIVITFIFKFLFTKFNRRIKKNILIFISVIFIATLPLLFKVNYVKLYKSINSIAEYAFNLDKNKDSEESDNERVKQIKQFVKEIQERPVLGYGHGASLDNVVRSKEKPWRYEMSFFDIVFHTGILGFILYITGPLWILFSLLKIASEDKNKMPVALAMFTGFLSVLIAFFTNPYLNAFDIQWVIYLPLFAVLVFNNKKDK